MAENSLETEIENRRASIVRAERSIAETELLADNSSQTNKALAALRLTVRGEKAVFAKLEVYRLPLR